MRTGRSLAPCHRSREYQAELPAHLPAGSGRPPKNLRKKRRTSNPEKSRENIRHTPSAVLASRSHFPRGEGTIRFSPRHVTVSISSIRRGTGVIYCLVLSRRELGLAGSACSSHREWLRRSCIVCSRHRSSLGIRRICRSSPTILTSKQFSWLCDQDHVGCLPWHSSCNAAQRASI